MTLFLKILAGLLTAAALYFFARPLLDADNVRLMTDGAFYSLVFGLVVFLVLALLCWLVAGLKLKAGSSQSG